jgi:hydroxymethylpyrimidine pyrophosphatase-like HAD family hydrolase
MAKLVVFDIEGTLLEKVGGACNKSIANINKMYAQNGYRIIIATGQPPSSKAAILKDFKKHGIKFDTMLMKPEDDDRKTREWKEEAIKKYLQDSNQKLTDIECVYENHEKTGKMWKKLGVQALIAYGFEDY